MTRKTLRGSVLNYHFLSSVAKRFCLGIHNATTEALNSGPIETNRIMGVRMDVVYCGYYGPFEAKLPMMASAAFIYCKPSTLIAICWLTSFASRWVLFSDGPRGEFINSKLLYLRNWGCTFLHGKNPSKFTHKHEHIFSVIIIKPNLCRKFVIQQQHE